MNISPCKREKIDTSYSHFILSKMLLIKSLNNLEVNYHKEVVTSLPCKHSCLALIQMAFSDLDLGAITSMTASTPKDEYCEFTTIRL